MTRLQKLSFSADWRKKASYFYRKICKNLLFAGSPLVIFINNATETKVFFRKSFTRPVTLFEEIVLEGVEEKYEETKCGTK